MLSLPPSRIRLVVGNQRGGVGKTTTALALARRLAGAGKRVLLVDTDPQGSIATALHLKAERYLADFLARGAALAGAVVPAGERIDVLCSNRDTVQAEALLMGSIGREMAFETLFRPVEAPYDAVLFDVAPSITLLQTCALVYAQRILVPVDMDPLSFQGAVASYQAATGLNRLFRVDVRCVGVLPTKVNRVLQLTKVIEPSLEEFCRREGIPLLPGIRVDQSVGKALKARQFLEDFDGGSRAAQDYAAAFAKLWEHWGRDGEEA